MKNKEIKKIKTLLQHINDYTDKLIDPQGVPENIVRDILKGHIRDFYERIDKLDFSELPVQKKAEADELRKKEKEAIEPEKQPAAHEKEKARADARELEEMKKSLAMLKKQFEEIENPEREEASHPVKEKPLKDEKPGPKAEAAPAPPPQKQPEAPKEPEVPKDKQEPKSPPKEVKESQKPEKQPSKKVIGEQFPDDKNSLNDFMSLKNGNHTIADRMKQNKVPDLKSAIDINHKFLFIRELFDGDSEEYKKTIEKLNTANTLEEAATILDPYRAKHNWAGKEETLNIFNEIIHRKF